jgi:hypothetical protein
MQRGVEVDVSVQAPKAYFKAAKSGSVPGKRKRIGPEEEESLSDMEHLKASD